MKKLLALTLSLLLLTGLSGCSTAIDDKSTSTPSATADSSLVIDGSTDIELGDEDMYITNAGTYTLSGELKGSVIVDVSEKKTVNLILDNVTIDSGDFAAIYVIEAEEVVITLADGSVNTLSDSGETYTLIDENDVDALIYSKADLSFEGNGTLVLNAGYKHGIVSKDDLILNGGTYEITAANHAIEGKDCVEIYDGSYTLTSGTDAISSDNEEDADRGYVLIHNGSFKINSASDGIYAFNYLTIEDGEFELTTTGKAIKSDTQITLNNGTYTIDSADDGIHTDGSITIEDGSYTIDSDDDAIHADYMLTINGGTFNINAHEGLEATVVTVNGGDININASDDGINAGAKVSGVTPLVEINDGNLTINMGQGDTDAIDSNGNLIINGGTITITAQSGFDFDGTGELNGGTVTVNGTQITSLTNQMMGGMGGMGTMPGGMSGNTGMTPGSMPQGGASGEQGQIPSGQQGGQRPDGYGGFPGQGGWH
ncbi:MAG: carbohydrate-binding domain-containing protein [Erysipelotrichaceae bacterium]|nr:carbohydrate-binding domain-containing protein [Erysipelotrichaceae bacterium]